MNRTPVEKFVRKFWLQTKLEDVRRQTNLPLTDIIDFKYWNTLSQTTRIHTVEIFNNDGLDPVLIAEDDGSGLIIPKTTGILDTDTSVSNIIKYTTNELTLTWNATYLAGLVKPPFIHFKIFSIKDQEEHLEFKDLISHVLQEYKTKELDEQRLYYDVDKVPSRLLDLFASDHNWTLDRVFSEEDSYLRTQLRYLFDFYKHRRRLPSVKYSVSVINKKVTVYNMYAKRGITDDQTALNYNDFSDHIKMSYDVMLAQLDTRFEEIQAVFDLIYADSSIYFPTKHFLLEMALDSLNIDGSLLRTVDTQTLEFYVLQAKSKTQYPHISTSLGVNALTTFTNQDGTLFPYKLTDDEAVLSIETFEDIFAGPTGVNSIAMTGTGTWATFPIIMNRKHKMNSGFIFNMDIDDLGLYIGSFKLGSDFHSVIDENLTALVDPFFSSSNIEFLFDGTNAYFTCTVLQPEANGPNIKEFGLFSKGGDLVFYVKNPLIVKSSRHTLVYKIKIKTA